MAKNGCCLVEQVWHDHQLSQHVRAMLGELMRQTQFCPEQKFLWINSQFVIDVIGPLVANSVF
jgi:hypothetical protein